MTGPVQTVLRVEVGRRTVWLHGLDRRQAIALCRRADVPTFMYDAVRGAWCAPLEYADAVLAVTDHSLHWRTVVEAVDR